MSTYTPKEFQAKIKRFASMHPDLMKKALKKATEKVRTEAVRNHLSGPKMQKGVGSMTSATLARRSGDLAGSINTKVKVTTRKQTAQVVSNMKYARVHEKGGKFMPKRPFLSSSLAKKRSEIVEDLLKAMMVGYKRS